MYVLISFLHHPTNVFSMDTVDWRFVAFIGYLIYKVLLFWCKYKTIKLYVQYLNVMIFIFVIIVFLSLKNHNVLKTWKIKSLRIFWNAEINFNFCSFYCVKKLEYVIKRSDLLANYLAGSLCPWRFSPSWKSWVQNFLIWEKTKIHTLSVCKPLAFYR